MHDHSLVALAPTSLLKPSRRASGLVKQNVIFIASTLIGSTRIASCVTD